jgi:hypothetical protein
MQGSATINSASAGISRERWHLMRGAQLRREECLPLSFGSRQAAVEHAAWRHARSRRLRETSSLDPNCPMVSSPVTPRSCHHGSILVPFHGVESVSATPRTAEAEGTAPAKKASVAPQSWGAAALTAAGALPSAPLTVGGGSGRGGGDGGLHKLHKNKRTSASTAARKAKKAALQAKRRLQAAAARGDLA